MRLRFFSRGAFLALSLMLSNFPTLALAQNVPQSPTETHANTVAETEAERLELEQQTRELQQLELDENGGLPALGLKDMQIAMQIMKQTKPRRCRESQAVANSDHFITTYNDAGEACRIYDLSFPLFRSRNQMVDTSNIPIRGLRPRTYLNLLRERTDHLERDLNRYEQAVDRITGGVTFLSEQMPLSAAQLERVQTGKFLLSDLDLNATARLPAEIEQQLDLLKATQPDDVEYDLEKLKNPKNLLSMVQVSWDADKKLYRMALDTDALPKVKKVALVNFNHPWKLIWEQTFRDVLRTGLFASLVLIPEPFLNQAVRIVIVDAFEAYNLIYTYQMNRLETVLNMNIGGFIPTAAPMSDMVRALDLIYAHRNGSVRRWLWNVVKTRRIKFRELEIQGNKTRALVENRREAHAQRSLAHLQKRKKCETQRIFTHFAVCTKNGQPQSIFTLIADRGIFFLKFGPVMTYHYKRRGEVKIKRIVAYTLSAASRMFAPINPLWAYGLSDVLKSYARQGLAEEAFFYEAIRSSQHDPRRPEALNQISETWLAEGSALPLAITPAQEAEQIAQEAANFHVPLVAN